MASAIYWAKKATSLGNVTSASVFLQSDNAAKAAAVYVPDQWQDGTVAGAFAFNLRAWGRVTPGTTGNFTPVIQSGTSITAASNTNCISGGAASYSASGCWRLDAQMIWDSTSKTVNGVFFGNNASAGFTIPLADSYTWYMSVTTAQTTNDTVFQTSVDGGTTYVNVPWRFAQVTTTTGTFVLNTRCGLGPANDVTAPTGTGTLIADTGGALALQAIVDPRFMKFKYTLSGTTAFTLYVIA